MRTSRKYLESRDELARRKVSHFLGLTIIAAFIAYPVIRFGLDALESTAIVFF